MTGAQKGIKKESRVGERASMPTLSLPNGPSTGLDHKGKIQSVRSQTFV